MSVIASGPNDQAMVVTLAVSTSINASSASSAPSASASWTDNAPVVTGRAAVRLTWRSNSRSATSLKQQPALRIRIVPSVNTATKCQPGKPPAAIHSALKVGQSSSSHPAGRFQRLRSKYSKKRYRKEFTIALLSYRCASFHDERLDVGDD